MKDLLIIKDLLVQYKTYDGNVKAINNINLTVKEGSTFGIVGETGAGKTTLAKSIMRLIQSPPGEIVGGEIIYDDQNLLELKEDEMRKIRGKHISMIFQDPMTSLNPVLTIGEQILEVIQNHNDISKAEAVEKTKEMLELVGIPGERFGEYPHQFSGGMKQRVIIAIALACNPRLLIADEPTTALDVTVQSQILEIMRDLKDNFKTSMILITHDLGVVAQNCDFVAIMYSGEILEYGEMRKVLKNAKHPYTIGLLNSIPDMTKDATRLIPIPGLMPDPTNLQSGCAFNERCIHSKEVCRESKPDILGIDEGHFVRCYIHENIVSMEEDNDPKKRNFKD